MTDREKPDDGVVVDCDLPHSPEKVWQAITDADLLAQWLTPSDLRPEVGARFRLPPAVPANDAPLVDCEVIEAVPQRTLRWRQIERESASETSHVESIVTLELFPNTRGTHLRIVHDQFRRVRIEARATGANVIPFGRRKTSARVPTIVCALRRAA